MNQTDSRLLLARYVRNRDEEAFREIVSNYFGLVQATALRRVNNDLARAGDITQIVFIDLARQASRLSSRTLLGSWLYKHTCFVASKFVRSEQRRVFREKEASQMLTNDSRDDAWAEVAPLLDTAILELNTADQSAIVLRFFERQDLRSIGAVFNLAKMQRKNGSNEQLRGCAACSNPKARPSLSLHFPQCYSVTPRSRQQRPPPRASLPRRLWRKGRQRRLHFSQRRQRCL